jgi:hypothetical protein
MDIGLIPLTIVLIACVVSMWVMIRMWMKGRRAGDCKWNMNPSVLLASYNSKDFRIFVGCVAVAIVAAIAYNLLFLSGLIGP